MRILLDLDGVLADFVTAACKIHGLSEEEYKKKIVPGEYCLAKLMGISIDEFFEPIHRMGSDFWLGLSPLPWMNDLLELVRNQTDDMWIVTSPTRSPNSYVGKINWIKYYFGQKFSRFVITQHKHLLANKDTILIDDRDSNIASFRKAGGHSLTFPTIHNVFHSSDFLDDPLYHVKKTLPLFLSEEIK